MRLARISIETRLRTRSWSVFISPPAFFLLRKEKARTWNKAFHPLLVEVKVSPVIWIMISAGTYLIMAMVPPCCKSRWSSSPFPSSPQWTAWLPQGMGSEIHFRQLTQISEIALDWSQRFHVIIDFKSRILRITFTSSTEGKPPRKESPPPWDISDLTFLWSEISVIWDIIDLRYRRSCFIVIWDISDMRYQWSEISVIWDINDLRYHWSEISVIWDNRWKKLFA